MIASFRPSLSAISASFKLLDTTARNIANANTNGYKKEAVIFKESPGGGVQADVARVDGPGPRYSLDGNVFEASNVDMAAEMVSLMTARHMLSLATASIRTADEMHKSLLDTFA